VVLAFLPITYTFSCPRHSRYMPRPPHLPRFDTCNYTWRKVQITQLLVCSFLHPPVTLFLFGPNILLRILFSNSLIQFCSHSMRDQYRIHTEPQANYNSLQSILYVFNHVLVMVSQPTMPFRIIKEYERTVLEGAQVKYFGIFCLGPNCEAFSTVLCGP
jgi:hypothetical protein